MQVKQADGVWSTGVTGQGNVVQVKAGRLVWSTDGL